MATNYYEVLGVPKDASDKDIRAAYRRLARKYHPDVNRGDPSAESKFKEINEAYQVLSNADSRKKYDQFGDQWRHADQFQRAGSGSGKSPFEWFTRASRRGGSSRGGFGSAGDLFSDLFTGGGMGGAHVENLGAQRVDVPVTVTLEEAYSGTARVVEVPGDPFSGAPGKRLEVKIPAGVRTGSRVHIGTQATGGAVDLFLDVTVGQHRAFERKGEDLHTTVDVPLADLVLGGEVEVPLITGKKVALKVPPDTQNGKVFRLKGKGMPKQGATSTYGDELVELRAVLPQHLTPEQRQLFEELRAAAR